MATDSLKAAAVQMQTVVGNPVANIELAERMAQDAFEKGARVVALPEFFTGAIAPSETAFEVVLPKNNKARQMLVCLAKTFGGHIGGSMLVADGDEIYNRYFLAEPDGSIHAHDKDLPTMWENAFYVGGNDDGVWDTSIGTIGAGVCWELIRHRTLDRMRGRVQLAMTGTHWWTMPENWPMTAPALNAVGQYNRYLSEQAPVEFARRIGAPVLQASHCGPVAGRFLLLPGTDISLEYQSHFVGATQVVDAKGQLLASRNTAEGPGIVMAEVTVGAVDPVVGHEQGRYWVPELPSLIKAYWHQQNLAGRSAYHRFGRRNGLEAARRNASWLKGRSEAPGQNAAEMP